MGCGFSGASVGSNPLQAGESRFNQFADVKVPDLEARVKEKADQELEKAKEKAIEKAVENVTDKLTTQGEKLLNKQPDLELEPATNIQYEIPEAFKHIKPMVPKGHPRIEELVAAQPKIPVERASFVTRIIKSETAFMHLECLDEKAGKLRIYQLNENLEVAKESSLPGPMFDICVHTDGKEYSRNEDGVWLQEKNKIPKKLQGKAYARPFIKAQFWGDYLFFVSDQYQLFRVSLKNGVLTQDDLTGSTEPVLGLEVMPDGKVFTIDGEGGVRDGVNVPPSAKADLQQYKLTKTVSPAAYNMPDSLFYILKRLSTDQIFASADDPDRRLLTVALFSRKLELLHMINLKMAAGNELCRRIMAIKEDSWRGHPLIISAREIFEIDLFLIAKNQIMHLQTISSYPNHSDMLVAEMFKTLDKVGSDWYIGAANVSQAPISLSPLKMEDYPLMRKIKWANF